MTSYDRRKRLTGFEEEVNFLTGEIQKKGRLMQIPGPEFEEYTSNITCDPMSPQSISNCAVKKETHKLESVRCQYQVSPELQRQQGLVELLIGDLVLKVNKEIEECLDKGIDVFLDTCKKNRKR